jgi:3-isopropylmalate/(R)-2-methylmalate dehydratase small subunit
VAREAVVSATPRIIRVTGSAIVLPGDDIDTDRIIPARFLKAVTFDGLGSHVFEDDRQQTAASGVTHPFDSPAAGRAQVLVVGANFGCGSSREHAPRAIALYGIRAIVGVSFAEIFLANAVAIGLPCLTMEREALARIAAAVAADAGVEVAVDLDRLEVSAGAMRVAAGMPSVGREALLTGQWDATGLLLERYDEVERVRATLPYLSAFPSQGAAPGRPVR